MALGPRQGAPKGDQRLLRRATRRALVPREHDSRLVRREVVEPAEILLRNRITPLVEKDDDRSRPARGHHLRLARTASEARDADDLARRSRTGRRRAREDDGCRGSDDEERELARHFRDDTAFAVRPVSPMRLVQGGTYFRSSADRRCPQRDSNPRYHLERVATWAASRWGRPREDSCGRSYHPWPPGRLAQLVERLPYTQVAAGSSPAPPISISGARRSTALTAQQGAG